MENSFVGISRGYFGRHNPAAKLQACAAPTTGRKTMGVPQTLLLPPIFFFCFCTFAIFSFAATPQSITSGWSGTAQCKVSVQGPNNYTHQETHTWQLTGGTPTAQGVIRLYPATWSVTGQGSFQKTQGAQSLSAQWTTHAAAVSGPIAFFFRASDHKLVVKSGHAQLRVHGGVTGAQQQTIAGKPEPPVPISLEAFEWPFPAASGAFRLVRNGVPAKELHIEGSSSTPTNGSVGPMQPGGSQGTAACTWAFVQGTVRGSSVQRSTPPPLPVTP